LSSSCRKGLIFLAGYFLSSSGVGVDGFGWFNVHVFFSCRYSFRLFSNGGSVGVNVVGLLGEFINACFNFGQECFQCEL
jgi:hypothetical protein